MVRIEQISDVDIEVPDYKDQSQSIIKHTTNGNSSRNAEIPALVEANAILVPEPKPSVWETASIKYAIVGIVLALIFIVAISATCSTDGRCSRNRDSGIGSIGSSNSSSSLIQPAEAPTHSPLYVNTPVAVPSNQGDIVQLCGDGVVGNGYCTDMTLCCSTFGYCGSTAEYCGGTCGNGNVGNKICPDSNLCCSTFGYCGSTAEYCNE